MIPAMVYSNTVLFAVFAVKEKSKGVVKRNHKIIIKLISNFSFECKSLIEWQLY